MHAEAGVALLGPRRVGETTLGLDLSEIRETFYSDMARTADRQILDEPDVYLDELLGKLVVIDEVQSIPGRFCAPGAQIARPTAEHRTGQFLLLGSTSNTLLQQSAELLMVRASHHDLTF